MKRSLYIASLCFVVIGGCATSSGSGGSTINVRNGDTERGTDAQWRQATQPTRPVLISHGNPATHQASGTQYPQQVGDLSIAEYVCYDTARLDCSANYSRPGGVLVTMYVYPTDGRHRPGVNLIEAEHDRAVYEIETVSQTTVPNNQRRQHFSSPHASGRIQGLHAWTDIVRWFDDQVQALAYTLNGGGNVIMFDPDSNSFGIPMQSHVYITRAGPWFVKYRVTHSITPTNAMEPDFATFLRNSPWPTQGVSMILQ